MNKTNISLENIAYAINTGKFKDGKDFTLLEFFKYIPFIETSEKFFITIDKYISDNYGVNSYVYRTIIEYIKNNQIDKIYDVKKEKLYSNDVYIDDVLITPQIIDDVFKYIDVYKYPKVNYVYCEVLQMYLNGEINMEKVKEREDRLKLLKLIKSNK